MPSGLSVLCTIETRVPAFLQAFSLSQRNGFVCPGLIALMSFTVTFIFLIYLIIPKNLSKNVGDSELFLIFAVDYESKTWAKPSPPVLCAYLFIKTECKDITFIYNKQNFNNKSITNNDFLMFEYIN
jgi:hypothetical protein